MPTFDVVSEVDMQEVRNAVDQAAREVANRFDFKNTGSDIELNDKDAKIELRSVSADRLSALRILLEEKFVKRKVSLKSLSFGEVEDAAGGTVRQTAAIQAGISSDKAKEINKFVKEHGPKGISSQTQGEQVRVQSKKRDDLQTVISAMKEHDFDIPLQFINFRD
ncbi:MAG: YajQ family cyclic di-GMP-binding protein [Acidimicrobiales bacterium]